MKIKAQIRKTFIPDVSILTLTKPSDDWTNIVSVSMDTKVAEYLVYLVNTDQEKGKLKKMNQDGFW